MRDWGLYPSVGERLSTARDTSDFHLTATLDPGSATNQAKSPHWHCLLPLLRLDYNQLLPIRLEFRQYILRDGHSNSIRTSFEHSLLQTAVEILLFVLLFISGARLLHVYTVSFSPKSTRSIVPLSSQSRAHRTHGLFVFFIYFFVGKVVIPGYS